ncbi:MAG: TlpA family protein disulfide reductase [Chloroflexi bacterium CFX2]|nr:TlpA family protein disulfide reductase [Chloroflexi bacterium CFX2]
MIPLSYGFKRIQGDPLIMKLRTTFFSIVLLTTILVTACGVPAEDAMMDKPTEEAMRDTMMTEETMDESMATEEAMMDDNPAGDAMMESPAWFSVALTNVRTGETFTIQDLKGKVILVETMAVWCSNCLRQQGQVKELHGLLGERDDFVSIGLDIDLNEDASKLKDFVDAQGFNWLYAVSPAEVSRDLSSLYGDQFLNPPSTPMLAIDRHGVVHPLPFGIKSAEDLLNFIQPLLDENM